MDVIKIVGGHSLNGAIPISGSKNAALPLMIASLLTDDTLTLDNVPFLADVGQLTRILGNLGVDYSVSGRRENQDKSYARTIHFTARKIVSTVAPYDLVSKMRASFWVIGPLLAREGEAKVSLPGGCTIGARPVDFIFDGLKKLGVKIRVQDGYAVAKAPNGLKGADYSFPKVSVGGTHVLIMAASLAHGDTILRNAACEPEIVNLADCINLMGGKIEGAGTSEICIKGVPSLSGARVRVIEDRIEAGTYAMAVAMTGGNVLLKGASESLLPTVLDTLRQTGTEIIQRKEGIQVQRFGNEILPVSLETDSFPGFPTDLQAQFMALMARASGKSKIIERIFENRFMHVPELRRLGAHITLRGQEAFVTGVKKLYGAPVMATDLRASVSLVIAGLAAEGTTTVGRVYHLDRGFEYLEEKLSACGANIQRVEQG